MAIAAFAPRRERGASLRISPKLAEFAYASRLAIATEGAIHQFAAANRPIEQWTSTTTAAGAETTWKKAVNPNHR